jgi:hypothetical protein
VRDVAFRPNRALIFLNSAGRMAPDSCGRRACGFGTIRLAVQDRPDRRSMESVCALLPAEQEPFWAGKGGDY